jgi:hypothetical protein
MKSVLGNNQTAGRKIFFKAVAVDSITESRGNLIAKVVFRGLDDLWRNYVHSRCDQGATNVLIGRGIGTCYSEVQSREYEVRIISNKAFIRWISSTYVYL